MLNIDNKISRLPIPNITLHKKPAYITMHITNYLHICATPANNILFRQNLMKAMHYPFSIKMQNFS